MSTYAKLSAVVVPLAEERRTHLPTNEAAALLNRKAQTLRFWASSETGPIRPVRLPGSNGLFWPVADLRRLLGVEAAQ